MACNRSDHIMGSVMSWLWYGSMPGLILSAWAPAPLSTIGVFLVLVGGIIGAVVGYRRAAHA
jgi:hypothetical protein